jgi:hypothetical protein
LLNSQEFYLAQVPILKVFIALLLLLSVNPAIAAPNCNTKVCVKVYTDPKTGKLIITAKQNGSSASPKPIPTRTWKPRPYTPRPYTPRPAATAIVPKKYTPKPVVKLSLSDQLTQLIPMKEIHHQPATSALVQVPVNFWTTTPPNFKTSVVMLGIPITVYLSPTYLWDFGDGTKLSSTTRGAPFPNQSITHTYTRTGSYAASLQITWGGTWKASGTTSEVSGGAIIQNLYTQVKVVTAPSKYFN